MFESDRLPDGWAERLRGMTEIWVPTHFHRDIFLRDSGLPPSRVRVVPEAVDVLTYAPQTAGGLGAQPWMPPGAHTKFLSVFKWEHRKGWDVLLSAWWGAFRAADAVRLYIRTSAYHSRSDFAAAVHEYLHEQHGCASAKWSAERSVRGETGQPWCVQGGGGKGATAARLPDGVAQIKEKHLPPITFVPPMSEEDMPRLYRSMHCLALPSRGEGWGRPHAEAMASGLPVIATAWSGPTEFMDSNNSLPLRTVGLRALEEGPFTGHQFAEPDGRHLAQLLRWVHEHPEAATALGRQARRDMVQRFSVAAVTDQVLVALRRLLRSKAPAQHGEL